jgi:hypothetical protein
VFIFVQNSAEYTQFDEPETIVNACARCMTRQEVPQVPTPLKRTKVTGELRDLYEGKIVSVHRESTRVQAGPFSLSVLPFLSDHGDLRAP